MADTNLIRLYLDGSLTPNKFANEFYPYIKQIASKVAYKLFYDADDLTQELWNLFETNIIKTYDFSLPLEPLVFEYARRHCLYLKSVNREVNFSTFSGASNESDADDISDALMQSSDDLITTLDDEGIHSRIIGDRLKKKSLSDVSLLMKLPSISNEMKADDVSEYALAAELINCGFAKSSSKEDVVSAARSIEKQSKTIIADPPKIREDKELGVLNCELRSIRKRMGKTKPQFARDIGINLASLDAYEYGRTKSVPMEVMKVARELESNFTDGIAGDRVYFGNIKMSQIVEGWASKLNVKSDDHEQLASILNTTRTTIRRWLLNESRADIEKIALLNSIVETVCQKNQVMI
jgi:transcriptional regulator with XRE-family HTH domain